VSLIRQKFYTVGAHVQAKKCRANGVTDEDVSRAIEAVRVCCGRFSGSDPEEDDVRASLFEQLSAPRLSGAPTLDPATIMLLVQLAILIYKALKAAGYLSTAGGFSASGDDIRKIIGEI